MAMELPPDFKDFLRLLNAHAVEYLLFGGHAVGYHGYPRATGDLDVWIDRDAQNAERVVAALREFGFDVPELSPTLFEQERRIVRMGLPPIRIEVITTIDGVEFPQCYPDRVTDVIDGVEVPIISFLACGRTNERADAQKTSTTSRTCLDRPPKMESPEVGQGICADRLRRDECRQATRLTTGATTASVS